MLEETVVATLKAFEVVDVDCPNCHRAIISQVSEHGFVDCPACKAISLLSVEPYARHKVHGRIGQFFVRVEPSAISVVSIRPRTKVAVA